ncbi:hypothetical protein CBR_g48844 [Chara braunii]|uniref:BRCT domain-containing protein n=1 Tax=Chara braunii TaxID=69332 RepID=A0A388M3G8_CHABU|nr:hypothetical protein CBR_g48844 [Chara braunii]|eukprot:GBG89137.1 hypothetical protein CBR_g48844 [Chara braunii]
MVLSYARIEGATGLQLIASQIPPDTEDDDENDPQAENDEVIPESPDARMQNPTTKEGCYPGGSVSQEKHRFRWMKDRDDERGSPWKRRPCNTSVGGPDTPYRSSTSFRSVMPPRKRGRWPANLGVKRVNNTVEGMESDEGADELAEDDAKMRSDNCDEPVNCSLHSPARSSRYLHTGIGRERLWEEGRRASAQRSLDWGEDDKPDIGDRDTDAKGSLILEGHPAGKAQPKVGHQRAAVPSADAAKLQESVLGARRKQERSPSPRKYAAISEDPVAEWEKEREREILMSGVRVCPPCPKSSSRPLFWASEDASDTESGELEVPLTHPLPGTHFKSVTTLNSMMGSRGSKEARIQSLVRNGRRSPIAARSAAQPSLQTPLKSEENVSKTFLKRKEKESCRDETLVARDERLQAKKKLPFIDACVTDDENMPAEAAGGKDAERWESSGRVGKIKNWMNRRSRCGGAGSENSAPGNQQSEMLESTGDGDCRDASGVQGHNRNTVSMAMDTEAQRPQKEKEGKDNGRSAVMRRDDFDQGCSLRTTGAREGVSGGRCASGGITSGDITDMQEKRDEEKVGNAEREREPPLAVKGAGKRLRPGKAKHGSCKNMVNCENDSALCQSGERKGPGGAPLDSACDKNGGVHRSGNGSTAAKAGEDAAPACVFCGQTGKSPVAGALLFHKTSRQCWRSSFSKHGDDDEHGIPGVYVHRLCATWAPNVYYKGDEFCNLEAEVNRSRRIRCALCSKPGAALGCFLQRCPKSYHYECAFSSAGSRFDKSHFVMYCPEHGSMSFPWESEEKEKLSSRKGKDERIPKRKRLQEVEATKLDDGLGAKKGLCRDASLVSAQSLPLSLGAAVSSPSQSDQSIVLCCSGLDPKEKELALKVASVTGSGFVKQWSPAVTHLVAGINTRKRAKRTLKFMFAVLHGQWVLSPQWLVACKEAGKRVAEEPFEVIGELHGTTGGPSQGRSTAMPKIMIVYNGIVTVKQPRRLSSDAAEGGNAFCQQGLNSVSPAVSRWKGAEALAHSLGADVVAVSHMWLLDTASMCQLRDAALYSGPPCSR